MQHRIFYILAILVFAGTAAKGQTEEDILQDILKSNTDSVLYKNIKKYNHFFYAKGEFELSIQKSNDIALKIPIKKFPISYASLLISKADCYTRLNQNEAALEQSQKADSILTNDGTNSDLKTKVLALTCNQVANNLNNLGDNEEALNFYEKALSLAKKIHANNIVATVYINMTDLFVSTKAYENAIPYLNEAILFLNSNYIAEPGYNYMAAAAYLKKGECLSGLKYYTEAKTFINKALPYILKEEENEDLLADYYNNLTQLFLMPLQNKDSAIFYANKLIQHGSIIRRSPVASDGYFLKAQVLEGMGKPLEAKNCYSKVLQDSSVNIETKIEAYKSLSMILYQLKEFKTAYELFFKYKTGADSLKIIDNNLKVNVLDKKLKAQVKQEYIMKLEQEQFTANSKIKTRNGIIIIALTVFLLTSLLLFQRYKTRQIIQLQKIGQLEKEKEILVTQSMLGAEEKERMRIGRDLHDGVGGMLSVVKYKFSIVQDNIEKYIVKQGLFTEALMQLDESISEVRAISHNLMPDAIFKFGLPDALKDYVNNISASSAVSIKLSIGNYEAGLIQPETELIIYRMVQELLQNVVKHAHAKNCYIQIGRDDAAIYVTIEDDGEGFDVNNKQVKGIGIANIYSRVAYLNGQVNIESNSSKGTWISLTIPLKKEK